MAWQADQQAPTVYKTFSYRIKDAGARNSLCRMARAVNIVWNYCNEVSAKSAERGTRWMAKQELRELTKGSSRLLDLPSQIVQSVIDEFLTRRKQRGRPKLRWRGGKAFGWIPLTNQDVVLAGDVVSVRGKKLRLWYHRPVEGKIKAACLTQDARGRWYCNLICELERPGECIGSETIGVDFGLATTATCSDGARLERANFYRDVEPKLAEAQRRRRRRQVRTLHAKVANRRRDALHKFSRQLVARCRVIAVGNISASQLSRSPMAKSVHDAGWSILRRYLRYKCDHAGVAYVDVEEHGTTRLCSACGASTGPQGLTDLGIRQWVCGGCGRHHDRDINAALNIARLGCETLGLKGPGSSANRAERHHQNA